MPGAAVNGLNPPADPFWSIVALVGLPGPLGHSPRWIVSFWSTLPELLCPCTVHCKRVFFNVNTKRNTRSSRQALHIVFKNKHACSVTGKIHAHHKLSLQQLLWLCCVALEVYSLSAHLSRVLGVAGHHGLEPNHVLLFDFLHANLGPRQVYPHPRLRSRD